MRATHYVWHTPFIHTVEAILNTSSYDIEALIYSLFFKYKCILYMYMGDYSWGLYIMCDTPNSQTQGHRNHGIVWSLYLCRLANLYFTVLFYTAFIDSNTYFRLHNTESTPSRESSCLNSKMSSKSKRTQIALTIPCRVCSAPAPEHYHFGGIYRKHITKEEFWEVFFQEDVVTRVAPFFGELFSELQKKGWKDVKLASVTARYHLRLKAASTAATSNVSRLEWCPSFCRGRGGSRTSEKKKETMKKRLTLPMKTSAMRMAETPRRKLNTRFLILKWNLMRG